ncbi:MarR family winged helix-turn-helix transcriptional regulator [Terrabacter sp. 2RAF25]|uniref:MarR family winged helix-turn-helix transcriptional regulator n=1 Tax=Terrabacter sp. 2RAF25 TaxID=3232998 RepID=UPI003F96D493
MHESSGERVAEIVEAWGRERPDVDVSSIAVLTPLWRLAARATENRTRVLAELGAEQSHLDVLATLRRAGSPHRLTAGELTRRCRVTAGATTQRVQAMERLGLVERVREEPDRRTVHVQLTADGLVAVDRILGDVMAGDEELLAGLTSAERSTLERVLGDWLARTEP